MAKIDIFDDQWCDMVFTDRNQMYGAYELRKSYARNSFLGIVLAIALFSLSVSAPLIIKLITDKMEDLTKVKVTEANVLTEPPPMDKTQPPPPPVEPPPPIRQTIKFTPPVIKPDEEVQDEPPPPADTKVEVGVKTQEGTPDAPPDLPTDVPEVVDNGNEVFTYVEQMPEFPGGESALITYIQKNTKYPPFARENNLEGQVIVNFVVDKEGNVTNVKVMRGIGGGCDDEAIRVIKSLPKFKPGKQNGRPAQVSYNVPVKFKLL